MARSLSKQFNKAFKQRLNEVKASPNVRKLAFSMAEERVEAARKVLAKEFDEHEVTQSLETRNNDILTNRFDYDGIYGTVLNRFIVQALNNHPITVYGTGGQTRAFIHIDDTAECIKIAVENLPTSKNVRVLNQVSETHSVIDLAKIVSNNFGCEIINYDNPRIELPENKLDVHNEGLKSLGFKPKLLSEDLINDVSFLNIKNSAKFDKSKVLNSPKWK